VDAPGDDSIQPWAEARSNSAASRSAARAASMWFIHMTTMPPTAAPAITSAATRLRCVPIASTDATTTPTTRIHWEVWPREPQIHGTDRTVNSATIASSVVTDGMTSPPTAAATPITTVRRGIGIESPLDHPGG